jgi:hypothetical protein
MLNVVMLCVTTRKDIMLNVVTLRVAIKLVMLYVAMPNVKLALSAAIKILP